MRHLIHGLGHVRFFGLVFFSTMLGISLPTLAQETAASCGRFADVAQDYRAATERSRTTVENYHFTHKVEALTSGQSGASIGADIGYTLNRFPNHPRALIAMMRYGKKLSVPRVPDAGFSVECYFERAIRYAPDDHIVRIIYSMFLFDKKRMTELDQQMQTAIELAKDDPFTHYNIGLAFFDFGYHSKALAQAHRAMALGFTRTQLKEQLQAAGVWVDPPALPTQAAASQPQ